MERLRILTFFRSVLSFWASYFPFPFSFQMEAERTFEIQVEYWKKDINSNSWPELFFDLSHTHTHIQHQT